MKRVFAFLTDYLIKKGLVQEEDRPIYEYGFQILIEIFLWVLCCTIIAALTCSLIELCIFFIIFSPYVPMLEDSISENLVYVYHFPVRLF